MQKQIVCSIRCRMLQKSDFVYLCIKFSRAYFIVNSMTAQLLLTQDAMISAIMILTLYPLYILINEPSCLTIQELIYFRHSNIENANMSPCILNTIRVKRVNNTASLIKHPEPGLTRTWVVHIDAMPAFSWTCRLVPHVGVDDHTARCIRLWCKYWPRQGDFINNLSNTTEYTYSENRRVRGIQ